MHASVAGMHYSYECMYLAVVGYVKSERRGAYVQAAKVFF